MSVITIPTLFQWGKFIFPTDYIKIDTYQVKPNQRQDLDSYTDANGLTHRNGLPNTKTEITFTTRQLRNREFDNLMSGIVGNYNNKFERDAKHCKYWDPEYCFSESKRMVEDAHLYLDPSLAIKLVNLIPQTRNHADLNYEHNLELYLVEEINWTFIEYGRLL